MRRAIIALWLIGSAVPFAGCTAKYLGAVSPTLPSFRIAILVRPVAASRCRTTTIPALAVVTSSQEIVWEVISLDRAACNPGAVRIAAKPSHPALAPTYNESTTTIAVNHLAVGRYQYTVTIGGESEDPELEVWR